YGVVGTACNIPYTETVLTIASAFDVMLGTMLGVSNRNYNKDESEGK
ncbi:MAG: phage holin, partial [Eubacterium ventriosum]